MRHSIEYWWVKNDDGKIIAVDVYIDGRPYVMDRGDLWRLYDIATTCFAKLPLPEIDEHTETNHQKVMDSPKK